VIDANNNQTGEIEEVKLSEIYSFKCKCGQSRLMCSLINPLCNEYTCSDKNKCPDCGEIKLIPKDQKPPEYCLKCGKLMILLGENGSSHGKN
jgi:hypothetical protein